MEPLPPRLARKRRKQKKPRLASGEAMAGRGIGTRRCWTPREVPIGGNEGAPRRYMQEKSLQPSGGFGAGGAGSRPLHQSKRSLSNSKAFAPKPATLPTVD